MKGDRIVEFIREYTDEHGWPPSYREIGDECDIKSTSNVKYWIDKLVEEGRLEQKARTARTIRVVA